MVTITPFYQKRLESLSGRKVRVLTNGFDEDDFKGFTPVSIEKFKILHVGIVNEKCDPKPFLIALWELIRENTDFGQQVVLEFVGTVHQRIRDFVKARGDDHVIFTAGVPHEQLISYYASSSVLLLVLSGYKDAEGYMPGKLFEYLATGLPVLGIGPTRGDASDLLKETGLGEMVEEKEKIKNLLLCHWKNWRTGTGPHERRGLAYSRENLTKQLVELLD